MKTIECSIPNSLHEVLTERASMDQADCDTIITDALSQYFSKPVHTLFQVSTSAALVEGLYQGAVRVSRLLQHGDFGLGTFVDLAGEMIVLDTVCYQVSPNGEVHAVHADTLIPYAVVTRFKAETSTVREAFKSLEDLFSACDSLRESDNIFYAFRIEGSFASIRTRVMRPVQAGVGLKKAAEAQEEFVFDSTAGTLVGLWSPGFAGSFSVPGYHFHFLSKDRQHGGHVLACQAQELRIDVCKMSEMHVSLPETEEFLRANLSKDPNAELMIAEQNQAS